MAASLSCSQIRLKPAYLLSVFSQKRVLTHGNNLAFRKYGSSALYPKGILDVKLRKNTPECIRLFNIIILCLLVKSRGKGCNSMIELVFSVCLVCARPKVPFPAFFPHPRNLNQLNLVGNDNYGGDFVKFLFYG